MKILIADDEQHIRNGLKLSLDWERLKIDEVFTAEDGEEALAVCRREQPEIILTDIRMPGIDGLELAEKAIESCGAKKVLIMSGYSEFSYAQSAIRIGAVDYLLKPIRLDELERTLEKIINNILEEKKKEELFFADILKEIVAGRVPGKEEEQKIIEKYKNMGEIFCVILRADRIYAGPEKSGLRQKAAEISAGLEERNFRLLIRDKEEMVFLWKAEDYQERSTYRGMIISALSSVCKNGVPWSAGVSITGGFSKLPMLYEQARDALKCRLYMEKERIIFYEDVFKTTHTKVYFAREDIRRQISDLQTENIKRTISKSFEKFREKRCINKSEVQEFCITFKNQLLDILKEKDIDIEGLLEKNASMFEKQMDYDVLSSYEKWLQDCCYLILKGVSGLTGKQHSTAVRKAIAYVNENYSRNITLAAIAEDVQKSTNYFCYIFKKDTGMNFNEYLNTVRINKAKDLLRTSEYMVYEISEMVGYHDYSYFAKVFKKICGCSPSEYKDKEEKS